MRIEVDIGHKWCGVAFFMQSVVDVAHILCLAHTLRGKSHQFATSIDDTACLCHTPFGVVGRDSGHRLDADGMSATHGNITHAHLDGRTAVIIE